MSSTFAFEVDVIPVVEELACEMLSDPVGRDKVVGARVDPTRCSPTFLYDSLEVPRSSCPRMNSTFGGK